MKMKLETPYLIVIFGLLLFFGVGNLWNHELRHEFPYGMFASDAFQQQVRSEGITDAGNYRNEPSYIVKGYDDVVGYYPPVIHHTGAILHFSSGLPSYDATYFMVFFAGIVSAFVIYIIIRSFNASAALLALPMAFLLFSDKSYVGFTWGHWASIAGQLMLIASFWALSRLRESRTEILLGIFMAALAMTHQSELVYGAVFIAVYCIFLLARKELGFVLLKKLFIAAAVALVISGYYLYVFANSFGIVNPYTFFIARDWGGTPIFHIQDFGLLLAFLLVGAVFSVPLLKKANVIVIAGFYMLLVGYTNYVGFAVRAFQPRLLWPLYFSVFFGLGIYSMIRFLPKAVRKAAVFSACAVFVAILAGLLSVPLVPAYSKISSPGLMDGLHWEAFQWISQNTPSESKVYFFYGDPYGQDAILRNTKRYHAQVEPEDFVAALQERETRKVYLTEVPGDHGAGMPYYSSFGKISLHLLEKEYKDKYGDMNFDVCAFDYFVFDKASVQPVLAQYNIIIANAMLGRKAELVFENGLIAILKNSNVNGDCIETGKF